MFFTEVELPIRWVREPGANPGLARNGNGYIFVKCHWETLGRSQIRKSRSPDTTTSLTYQPRASRTGSRHLEHSLEPKEGNSGSSKAIRVGACPHYSCNDCGQRRLLRQYRI